MSHDPRTLLQGCPCILPQIKSAVCFQSQTFRASIGDKRKSSEVRLLSLYLVQGRHYFPSQPNLLENS